MKNKSLILPIISLMSLVSLTGCQNETIKPTLTYGSYLAQPKYSKRNDQGGYPIKYGELESRMLDGENMVVAIYPGDDSSCSCWINFKYHIKTLVNEHHYKIYTVNYLDVPSNNEYGFKTFYDKESLYIIEDGKIAATAIYGDEHSPRDIFESSNLLKDYIDGFFRAPNIYEVDKPTLDKKKAGDCNIYFSRTNCPDCKAINPYLYDFFDKNEIANPLYYFDLDPYHYAQKDATDGSTPYDDIKAEMELTKASNEKYGYNTGYVPTLQVRKGGIVEDAIVTFNDTISKIDNKFVVSESFFTNERLPHLKYLENETTLTTVLKGLELDDEAVSVYDLGEGKFHYSWKHKKAMEYHKPLLEKFLNLYF